MFGSGYKEKILLCIWITVTIFNIAGLHLSGIQWAVTVLLRAIQKPCWHNPLTVSYRIRNMGSSPWKHSIFHPLTMLMCVRLQYGDLQFSRTVDSR